MLSIHRYLIAKTQHHYNLNEIDETIDTIETGLKYQQKLMYSGTPYLLYRAFSRRFVYEHFRIIHKTLSTGNLTRNQLKRLKTAVNGFKGLGEDGFKDAFRSEYYFNTKFLEYSIENTDVFEWSLLGGYSYKDDRWVSIFIEGLRYIYPNNHYPKNKVNSKIAAEINTMVSNIGKHYIDLDFHGAQTFGVENYSDWIDPAKVLEEVIGFEYEDLEDCVTGNITFHLSINALKAMIASYEYRLDNEDFPDNLQQLVPLYLETTPIDPFDGKPLRYDSKALIIFSVGTNLTEETPEPYSFFSTPPSSNVWELEKPSFPLNYLPKPIEEEQEE